jgi:acyl-CoA thioesterase II
MAAPSDITKVVAVRELSENEYESINPPERMGAFVERAFGGVTSAMALNAAAKTVSAGLHIYSLQGNFLGPALIDRTLHLSVRRIRDTRTFATRQIEASQLLDDGKRRICLIVVADFMAQEPVAALQYSEKPRRDWGMPEDGKTVAEISQQYVDEGKIPEALKEISEQSISFALGCYEMRFCPGAPFGTTLMGGAKHLSTPQDHLGIAEKVSADYVKSRAYLTTEDEHITALTCLCDMAMGFIAVAHNRESLGDYGAVSSLDFSLRFFSNHIDMNQFYLREMVARVGAEGRSFHETRIWDETRNLVACMTQQAIIRPKQELKKNGAKI